MFGPLLFNALLIGTALYATWRGGSPERWAALMQIVAALATMSNYTFPVSRFYQLESGVFAIDLALSAGLFWLALRSNRIWPMVMAALQLSSLLVHLARVVDLGMSPWAYAFLLKIWGYPIVILLAAAVLRHRLRLDRFGVDAAWSR